MNELTREEFQERVSNLLARKPTGSMERRRAKVGVVKEVWHAPLREEIDRYHVQLASPGAACQCQCGDGLPRNPRQGLPPDYCRRGLPPDQPLSPIRAADASDEALVKIVEHTPAPRGWGWPSPGCETTPKHFWHCHEKPSPSAARGGVGLAIPKPRNQKPPSPRLRPRYLLRSIE